MSPKIIAIDGNIGAGKTTFLEKLEEKYKSRNDIIILKEPVEKWMSIKDIKGESVLENYYKDPKTYSFMFQVMVFQTILEDLKKAYENKECKIIICERSIASALNVFTKMLHEDEYINMIEYKVYTNFYTRCIKETFYPNEIYYLDIPADVCYQRVLARQREGETNITIEYLQKCEKYYEDWFSKEKRIKITRVKDPDGFVFEEFE